MKILNSKGFVWSPELGATIITILVLVAIPTTLFLTQTKQDTRQQASSTTQNAQMIIDPPSGVYAKGQKFAVSLIIDAGRQTFSSVKATVGVSSQLEIESLTITPEFANGCEFNFTDPNTTPNATNPSFYGILPESTKSKCSLYTLTLIAKQDGPGSVFITNAEIISGTGNINILEKTIPGVYTITK